MMFVLTVYI